MADRPDPKISTSEAVLIGMFLLALDAIDLIPIAGDLTDIAGAPLIFYYYTKHINGVAYIVSEILDAIPIVQEIPSRSIVWWGTVALDRFAPAKVEEAVEKIGEEAEGGEGEGGGELGGEGGLNAETSGGAERGVSSGSSAEGVQEEGVGGGETTSQGVQEEEVRRDVAESGGPQGEEGGEGGGQSVEFQGEGENPREESGEQSGGQKNGNGEDISATESEEEPMAVTESDLFTQSGDESSSSAEENGEDEEAVEEKARAAPPRHSGNAVSIDGSRKWQQNQRRKKTKPSTADVIPPEKMAA